MFVFYVMYKTTPLLVKMIVLQEVFYDSALNKVLSLSMAHHFHTRIHALAVLSLMWDQCKTLGLQAILNRHSIIHACFSFFDEDK